MNASRLQHTIMAATILAVACTVAWLSFTQEPAGAYLFPRLISVFFVALALWNLARAAAGLAKVGSGVTKELITAMTPGMIVMLLYVFFAAKLLGFHASSAAAFFLIYTLYDPAPLSDLRAWIKRILATLGFMAVMYGLFDLLLKVQSPRGLFL